VFFSQIADMSDVVVPSAGHSWLCTQIFSRTDVRSTLLTLCSSFQVIDREEYQHRERRCWGEFKYTHTHTHTHSRLIKKEGSRKQCLSID